MVMFLFVLGAFKDLSSETSSNARPTVKMENRTKMMLPSTSWVRFWTVRTSSKATPRLLGRKIQSDVS